MSLCFSGVCIQIVPFSFPRLWLPASVAYNVAAVAVDDATNDDNDDELFPGETVITIAGNV